MIWSVNPTVNCNEASVKIQKDWGSESIQVDEHVEALHAPGECMESLLPLPTCMLMLCISLIWQLLMQHRKSLNQKRIFISLFEPLLLLFWLITFAIIQSYTNTRVSLSLSLCSMCLSKGRSQALHHSSFSMAIRIPLPAKLYS